MDLGLKGRRVVVTGGTHGIGLATALAFAREGCAVAVCSRTAERVAEAQRQLGPQALAIQVDVLEPKSIREGCERVLAAWGGVDILINNVGGGGRWGSDVIEETSEQVWLDVFDKNAMAAVRFTRHFLAGMRRQKWGRVITVSSIYGKEGGGRPWFNMAKSAEVALMKSLARTQSLARDGITFNTVAPGAIMIPDTGWTEWEKSDPMGLLAWTDKNCPLGRLGKPEEVAASILFLASEAASLVNGACLSVDGGESHSF